MKLLRLVFVLGLALGLTVAPFQSVQATVNDQASRNAYTGDGTTTVFPYTFEIFVNTALSVSVNGTLMVLSTDYTVSGVGASGGGNVTMTVAPALTATVIILRNQPFSQGSNYVPNQPFPSTQITQDLDKLIMVTQQLREQMNRALLLLPSSTYSLLTFPDPTAGSALCWNAGLTGLQNCTVVTQGTLALPVVIANGGTNSSTALSNNRFMISSSGKIVEQSALTASSFLYTNASGLAAATAAPTNGQLLIGSSSANPVAATITAATGATITNGAGSITVGAKGGLISETFYGFASSSTVTISNASPAVVTFNNGASGNAYFGNKSAGLNMPVVFTTSGALPSPLVVGTTYYLLPLTSVTANVAATPGGSAINTTNAGSGTHTANPPAYVKATNNPSLVEFELLGGGGGSGSVTAVAGAVTAGGGGGAYVKTLIPASALAASVTLTVGYGGLGGSAGTDGATGNGSGVILSASFTLTVGGGVGTPHSSSASAPALGGSPGLNLSSLATNTYPGTLMVVGGSYGGTSISTAAAATSYSGFGGAGAVYGCSTAGTAGVTNPGIASACPGSGGSGAAGASAQNGANGTPGLIIIREYY